MTTLQSAVETCDSSLAQLTTRIVEGGLGNAMVVLVATKKTKQKNYCGTIGVMKNMKRTIRR
jgi:hypothetical protein